jgi:hypothetical protein
MKIAGVPYLGDLTTAWTDLAFPVSYHSTHHSSEPHNQRGLTTWIIHLGESSCWLVCRYRTSPTSSAESYETNASDSDSDFGSDAATPKNTTTDTSPATSVDTIDSALPWARHAILYIDLGCQTATQIWLTWYDIPYGSMADIRYDLDDFAYVSSFFCFIGKGTVHKEADDGDVWRELFLVRSRKRLLWAFWTDVEDCFSVEVLWTGLWIMFFPFQNHRESRDVKSRASSFIDIVSSTSKLGNGPRLWHIGLASWSPRHPAHQPSLRISQLSTLASIVRYRTPGFSREACFYFFT